MLRFLKRKTKKSKSGSHRYFQLQIKEVRKETEDTNTLVFEFPDRPFEYQPGQFLTLILPIKGEEKRRSYSLCTSPYTKENPAITVKRVESGSVSNFLNDHMKKGDVFDVMEPAGHFVPDLREGQAKKYVMFAAGSGITPIMSIIKSILIVEQNSTITLVYQNRNENSIIFKDELKKLQEQHPDRFEIIDVLSKPEGEWKGYRGRLSTATTSDILMDIAENKIERLQYFLCGPDGFMQKVIDTLVEFEVPENQIRKESFFTPETKPKAKEVVAPDSEAYDVKVLLDGEEYDVLVPANKSILEAALDQQIDMPFSCQSGLCTACRGKLLSGEVMMDEDDGLSSEELEQGYILNCVSRPKSSGIKVEIG
jgi:ring-1,2-phenylacetyl-CoA epoxidase subunit PaaE